MRSVTAQLAKKKPTTFADLQKKYRTRLANARDNRPRHIQRRELSSGWTLSQAERKKIKDAKNPRRQKKKRADLVA